ncbi:VOC family protein [Pseudoroseomonas globiformis]|uniref:VOC family protein n=1 Tax=Teichococcus globiformis TaxID=2307229 RepID=A0ABV7G5R0_9PROT
MSRFTMDHIHLRSPDPDAAARFYTEKLDATVAQRLEGPDSLRVVVDLAGLKLFIERVPADTVSVPPPPFQGLEHIGLAVKDIDAVAAELKSKGVEFTLDPMSPKPGIRIAFFKAPDAVRIEILERS